MKIDASHPILFQSYSGVNGRINSKPMATPALLPQSVAAPAMGRTGAVKMPDVPVAQGRTGAVKVSDDTVPVGRSGATFKPAVEQPQTNVSSPLRRPLRRKSKKVVRTQPVIKKKTVVKSRIKSRPIVKRRKIISRPARKSTNVLKVITGNPMFINKKIVGDRYYEGGFLNLDGESKSEVVNFQSWANRYKKTALKLDGVFGPKTKEAYNMYGQEYDGGKIKRQSGTSASTENKQVIENTEPVKNETQSDSVRETNKKFKLNKTQTIALIVAGGILTIVAIRLIQKRVKK